MSDDWTPQVLLVDDSPTRREMLRIALQAKGYHVSVAEDGAAALARIRSETEAHLPDLVVSDVNMPGLDGVQLQAEITDDPRLAGIPVVLFTQGREKAREERQSLGAGEMRYLKEAVDTDRVPEAVEARVRTLRIQRRLEALKQQIAKPRGDT